MSRSRARSCSFCCRAASAAFSASSYFFTCQKSLENVPFRDYLLLNELKFLGFQKLLGDTLRVLLAAQTQRPQLFTELGGIFVQEPSELDLKFFDIGLAPIAQG